MKKIILYSLVSSGVLFMSGCNEAWNTGLSNQGSFTPVVDFDTEPITSSSSRSSQAPDEVSVNDLRLILTPDDAKGIVREWESINDFNPEETFAVGGYTLEALYGSKNEEGFDKPYYYGSTRFSVRENETTPVSMKVTLGNALITPTFAESFTGYFTNYSVDFKTIAGNTLSYSSIENRPIYVSPGTVQMVVNVVKPTGVEAQYTIPSFVAESRYHYHIKFEVNDGNVGGAELNITFDDALETDNVIIDLSQDLENLPAPVLTPRGFENGVPVNVVTGAETDNPLEIVVQANAGMASVKLETNSISLKEQGWPESIDLLAVPLATKTTMSALGFGEIGLWQNPDRMALIMLTDVLSNIRYIEGVSNENSFTLTVTDRLSRTVEVPVVLNVNIERLNLEILNPSDLYYYATELTFDLNYNGSDAVNRVDVQYLNMNGVWTSLSVDNIAPQSRADVLYSVNVSGLPTDAVNGEKDVTLRAVAKDARGNVIMTSQEVVVNRLKLPFDFTLSENNVFATHATAVLSHDSEPVADFAQRVVLEISTDNGAGFKQQSYRLEGEHVVIENLTPGTDYMMRIKADGHTSRVIEYTTEADLQLPNSGMEEWYSESLNSNQVWYYPWNRDTDGYWNTYNPVTMSQGNGGLTGYAYKATSGTVSTSDSYTGESAAQIRTVGWGSSNTASANAFNRWSFGTCQYVSAGQLFLGNWTDVNPVNGAVPNYGMNFPSRPSSLSFWYKYAVMNSSGDDNGQKGVAIIQILDIGSNVIAEQTIYLDPNAAYSSPSDSKDYSVGGSYVQQIIELSYPFDAAKADKIVVTFKSTQFTDEELNNNKNQNNMRPPQPLNLNNCEYLGSSLLIDDITLNY